MNATKYKNHIKSELTLWKQPEQDLQYITLLNSAITDIGTHPWSSI